MLTEAGIDYICQNFGDTNFCCVDQGLSWYYTYQGMDYHETGATAQIVSRFTLGIIESLTMTYPPRGTYTQAMLNAANGAPVTLQDAKTITYHDEPDEDQWCYVGGPPPPPPSCSDYDNQADCIAVGCYWWSDNTCHDYPEPPPDCDKYTNPTDCVFAGCFWWDSSCHDSPAPPPPTNCSDYTTQTSCENAGCYWWSDGICRDVPEQPIPPADYLPYIIAGAGATIGIIAVYLIMRKKR